MLVVGTEQNRYFHCYCHYFRNSLVVVVVVVAAAVVVAVVVADAAVVAEPFHYSEHLPEPFRYLEIVVVLPAEKTEGQQPAPVVGVKLAEVNLLDSC